jgi:hypothetical protein
MLILNISYFRGFKCGHCLFKAKLSNLSSVVDPDLLNPDPDTDPDLAFQLNLDMDPDKHFKLIRIRIRIPSGSRVLMTENYRKKIQLKIF